MASRLSQDPDDLASALLAPARSAATQSREVLERRISGPAQWGSSDGRMLAQGGRSNVRALGYFSEWANPKAMMAQSVFARSSRSSAEGLWVQDSQVWDLLDEMPDRDLAIAAAERNLISKIAARPTVWRADPEHPWTAKGKDLARESKRAAMQPSSRMGWSWLLTPMVRGLLRHGLSVTEIIWENRAGRTVPKAFVHCHPGSFKFDADGNICFGAGYEAALQGRPLPPNKFIVATVPALYGNPWGDSALWYCRWLYEIKKLAILGWVEFADSSGAPFLAVKIPAEVQDQDGVAAAAMTALKNLRGGDAGIVLPLGLEVEAVSRSLNASSTPQEAVIDWCNYHLSRFLEGSTLASGESQDGSGSRAASQVHADSANAVARPVADYASEAIRQGYCDAYAAINAGELMRGSVIFAIDMEDRRDADLSIRIIDAAARHSLPMAEEQACEWLGVEPAAPGAKTIKPTPQGGFNLPALPPEGGGFSAPARARRFTLRRDLQFAAPPPGPRHRAADARWFLERLRAIGDTLKIDNLPAYLESIRNAGEALEAAHGPAAKVTEAMVKAAKVAWPETLISGDEAVAAARGLAYLQTYRAVSGILEGAGKLPDPSAIDPHYKAAAEWMVNRKIATRETVNEIAQAVAYLEGGTAAQIARSIRQDVLAIAAAPAPEITIKYQEALAQSIGTGGTVGEFLKTMDDALGKGTLPESMNGYLEMVHRTETGNAYARQSELAAKDPDIADFVWGREFHNARLPSSRPSHVAMDGVRVRKGSAADAALGQDPPWSFNCTCVAVLLVSADPENQTEYTEPPNALALVMALERFEDSA